MRFSATVPDTLENIQKLYIGLLRGDLARGQDGRLVFARKHHLHVCHHHRFPESRSGTGHVDVGELIPIRFTYDTIGIVVDSRATWPSGAA